MQKAVNMFLPFKKPLYPRKSIFGFPWGITLAKLSQLDRSRLRRRIYTII